MPVIVVIKVKGAKPNTLPPQLAKASHSYGYERRGDLQPTPQ